MYLDIYIGDANDPTFSWDSKNWSTGNVPRRISPFFPPQAPFFEFIQKIKDGNFEGKQTDWGGWTAKVTKAQILDFTKEFYSSQKTYQTRDTLFPHLYEQMQELLQYVNALEDEGAYLLVATET